MMLRDQYATSHWTYSKTASLKTAGISVGSLSTPDGPSLPIPSRNVLCRSSNPCGVIPSEFDPDGSGFLSPSSGLLSAKHLPTTILRCWRVRAVIGARTWEK
ncbi:MAG: hypothetical protein WAY88_05150 [Minisyncoccia bacterium]